MLEERILLFGLPKFQLQRWHANGMLGLADRLGQAIPLYDGQFMWAAKL